MKLHSPKFEKALCFRVKQAVRGSKELKREFALANRFRRTNYWGRILRLFFACVLGFLVWGATTATHHVATGLAIINFWMLMALSFQAQGIRAQLHASMDIATLTLLPISRGRIFQWQLQKYFRNSLFALFDLAVGFGALSWYCHFPPLKWAAAFLVAVLAWGTLLALAALCVVRFQRLPLEMITSGLYLTGLVVLFGRTYIWPAVLKAIDQAAPELNLLLPTGWPVSLFQIFADDHPLWFLLLLLPVAVVIATTKDSLKRLFAGFQYQEYVYTAASDMVPGTNGRTARISSPENPVRLGPTAIEEIIQSRKFLSPPEWPLSGWLERGLWRWLGRREKVLAEFVFPRGCTLTRPWISIFRNLAITAIVVFAAGALGPTIKFSLLALGLFITICQALAQMISHGGAFQPMQFSGVSIPRYAGYGIGYGELSRFLIKCSLIQFPMLLVYSLAASALTAYSVGLPIPKSLTFGLKFGGLLFASRFIFLTLAFSGGTNDTSRFRFRALLLLFLLVILGFAFLGLSGAGLFMPEPSLAWLLCGAAALDAFLFFWIYEWFYHSGRFDIISLPRR